MTVYYLNNLKFILSLFLSGLVGLSEASLGDSFPTYRSCVESCRNDICDKNGYYFVKKDVISLPLLLLWKCTDDCQYRCMWGIIDLFEKKGWPPPQFHGKWPFVRILGVQEPASTIFSLINLGIHVRMLKKFTKEFQGDVPMFGVYGVYGLVSINGWIWSTVFHTRDTNFTELMDYLSAFALVFCSVYSVGMRLLLSERRMYRIILTVLCCLFYINHALYLSAGPFDYGYNLIANISVGVITMAICAAFIYKNWRLPQSKHLGTAAIILTCSLYLEVSDFPPVFWFLDAHALWHACTAPSIYYFWRFVLEDSKYLRKQTSKRSDRQENMADEVKALGALGIQVVLKM